MSQQEVFLVWSNGDQYPPYPARERVECWPTVAAAKRVLLDRGGRQRVVEFRYVYRGWVDHCFQDGDIDPLDSRLLVWFHRPHEGDLTRPQEQWMPGLRPAQVHINKLT